MKAFLPASDEPIRAELLSVERLEQYAETLAAGHSVPLEPDAGLPLGPRLRENAEVLKQAYAVIARSIQADHPITPAAEWLLDNFHIVEEQVREIIDDLPVGFYRRLPKLKNGALADYPRVFAIAWELVAHTDSGFDLERLTRFIAAYQRVQPLTIGELWAIAITLRITLVENLRRLTEDLVRRLSAYQDANEVADRIIGAGVRDAEPVDAVLRSLGQGPVSKPFAVQLSQRLRDQDQSVIPALLWLDERLKAAGTSQDEIVREEHHIQGGLNVSVRNVITSMRLVSTIDWPEFVESVSLVDAALRAKSDFGALDFPTRDLYRRSIEALARGSGLGELDVARRAIEIAARPADGAPAQLASGETDERRRDPGYYLIARGRQTFERELGYRAPPSQWPARLNKALGPAGYLALITAAALTILALALAVAADLGCGPETIAWLALAGLIPASDMAVAFVNQAVISRFGPAILPALELRDGVPESLRTFVVMPVLLTGREEIAALIQHLEVHFLSSAEGEFYYALLSDWTDSDAETAPDDAMLLETAIAGIDALNRRHGPGPGGQRFFLLHRKRLWNKSQGKWMGWERKRGKLHELNRLLRGAADTSFVAIGGRPVQAPPAVRYVLTLDADTRLPRGAARRLVGKMAHPLNRPQLDPESRRVVEGHGIMQPRVTPSLPMARGGSLFQRAFSGSSGLDPYAFAVSDIYQDLFGEGSYVGKGIYDVDCFEAVLHGRIPENAVLSHDLLEGIFTRAALASDVELVEEFPSRYDVAAARQHRWTRGDWQLLPWLFAAGRSKGTGRKSAAIPLIGRWKMLDNLRRSLSAPAAMLALLGGWLLPPALAGFWTAFVIGTMALPLLLPIIRGLIPRRVGISGRNHLRGLRDDFVLAIVQSGFLITFLAHQALLTLDAVLRTLFRIFIARRRMLEWTTAAQAAAIKPSRRVFARQLVGSCLFGVVAMAIIVIAGYGAWPVAAPFLILWAISPALARRSSADAQPTEEMPITAAERQELRSVARETWRFFETFITAENNMLPPDNFQEDPQPVIASRTSPTNIGLYLLSIVVARDFGWIALTGMVERLEAIFATLARMNRFRGHFYNWYDTADLRPLDPKYISSVDSGNLAGHLIALGNACRSALHATVSGAWADGAEDSLRLAREHLGALRKDKPSIRLDELDAALAKIGGLIGSVPTGLVARCALLADLTQRCAAAVQLARTAASELGGAADELLFWVEAIQSCIGSEQREIETLAPWALLLAQAVGSPPPALAEANPTIAAMPDFCAEAMAGCSAGHSPPLLQAIDAASAACAAMAARLTALADAAQSLYGAMEFGFLFNVDRKLLSIGYQVQEGVLDDNDYDLLASEARLASFVAIAKEDVPPKHWFRLGRTLTPVGRGSALISWSGSMFEYLMPALIMHAPAGSLLEGTNRQVVRRQISYGAELGVPWGISESQYNARDLDFNYQYSGFGVPDLGYKRGLANDIVIAPYATGLASMVDPGAAARNYKRLEEQGGRGRYGWYEALDYTAERLPEGARVAVIRAYMAHHQAMTIVAIANALRRGDIRAQFHAEPIVQATELLLQERMPRNVPVARPPSLRPARAAALHHLYPEMQRRFNSPHSLVPRTHLLSNGRYSVMISGAGSGFSRWRGLDVTRWREDATLDNWGSYIFLRDMRTSDVWSTGYQPSGAEPDRYEVVFSEDRAEIIREDSAITTTMVIAVSPEDDAEVRRVTITNNGSRLRDIELTSYAEIVLASHLDDRAHQAFSKLFVETEFIAAHGAILAKRRPRKSGDPQYWAAHLMVVEGETLGDVQFETDRARFLGRGQGVRMPASVVDGWPLSNTVGAVLDPIFSLRRRVRLARGASATLAFWTMVADSRDAILGLVDKHHDAVAYDRATTLAWTQAQVQLHHLGIGPAEAHLYQRLANRIIYSDPTLRPFSDVLKRGARRSSTLWANGISGDLPIVLLRIDDFGDIDVVRETIRAFEYWRMKQLSVDLVILNEKPASYVQDLQNAIETLVRTSGAGQQVDGVRGGVFMLRADLAQPEVLALIQSAARIVLLARRGTLAEQVRRLQDIKPATAPGIRRRPAAASAEPPLSRPALEFFNGFGGFADDGRDYVTILEQGQWTPAPWVNVIANPGFGFHVSTEGGGFTWAVNSQQNQITPWSNDPVRDPVGEVFYVRDDETGDLWTPTALPIREASSYVIRHGQGYSKFEHTAHDIALELRQYVPIDDPIKISRLRIANLAGRARRLSVTAYVEWVLGTSRGASAPFIITEIDPATGAMHARNPWNNDFGERVAFIDLSGRQTAWTGDRTEFLGRNGAPDRPAALIAATPLSGAAGAGFDPCGALQTSILLGPNETTEIVLFLGQTDTAAAAAALIRKYREADLDAVLAAAVGQWKTMLGAVQAKTPDRAMDIMLNGWLPYQTLACRVWARAGFYQASGAYGFRDQLQDVMALCVSRPDVARAHILRAAGRQFPEGDVQHWWLAESGRGIRTRISDDAVWLSHVAMHYVGVTGDAAILDEIVPFIEGPKLKSDQNDGFFEPAISEQRASLFEHCARGLDLTLAVGAHGLPLMGTGDWNDGMNEVGAGGKGESVWLGWFLYAALTDFAQFAYSRGESRRAAEWLLHSAKLKDALEQAWDGDWYKRAYFDDGSPLGSVANSECRIDSIAQSWSVIAKGADPARGARAMAAVEKYLVRRDESMILLFSPPFENSVPNPGYIQGYPKGVRENGGQYSHGATWSVLAFAMLGDGDRAAELYAMMNPINHGSSRAAIHRYRVEPYVACGDLYSMPPQVGRGGWTWYTGSAGWMYRVAMEGILGFKPQGGGLRIDPCIPRTWPDFEILFRYRSATYDIAVANPNGVCRGVVRIEIDGEVALDPRACVPLTDDGGTHRIRVTLG
jgi:cyclic beta-1,2-glucan synthetase